MHQPTDVAVTTATPTTRVASITMIHNTFEIFSSSDPVVLVWSVLDRCVAPAEQRAHAHFATTYIPAALVKMDVTFSKPPNASIIGPLATRYPTLVRSLRVLNIVNFGADDESAALEAFGALATQLRELTLMSDSLTSVQGLAKRCQYLQKLNLVGCHQLSSIDALAGCVYLEEVNAANTAITSIESLRTCPALTKVDLSECEEVSSIEALEYHQHLQEVDLSRTGITSIEPLRTCPNLTKVTLWRCRYLSSMEALTGHQWLQEVTASGTAITSIEPLRTCPALKKVVVVGCMLLSSIDALEGHQSLREINASNTPITSIASLRTCPALTTAILRLCQQLPAHASLHPGVNVMRR